MKKQLLILIASSLSAFGSVFVTDTNRANYFEDGTGQFPPSVLILTNLPNGILTNAAAFQPARNTLTNLANGNGGSLTNINLQSTTNSLRMGALTSTGTNIQGAVLVVNTNDPSGRSYTNAPTLNLANCTNLPVSSVTGIKSFSQIAGATASTVNVAANTNIYNFPEFVNSTTAGYTRFGAAGIVTNCHVSYAAGGGAITNAIYLRFFTNGVSCDSMSVTLPSTFPNGFSFSYTNMTGGFSIKETDTLAIGFNSSNNVAQPSIRLKLAFTLISTNSQ